MHKVGSLVRIRHPYDNKRTIRAFLSFPGERGCHQSRSLSDTLGVVLEIKGQFTCIYVDGCKLWTENYHVNPIQ